MKPSLLPLALTLSVTALNAQEQTTPAQPPAAATPAPEPQAPAQPAPQAVPAPAPAPAPAQPAFSQKVLDAIGTPPEGKALIVFFRPSKFIGAMIGYIVREDEKELGKLRSGNYFTIAVEPGKHTYVVHSEAKDTTTMEAEAGETYFFLGSISIGFFAGHPHLTPSDAAAFEEALPKMKPSTPLKAPEPAPAP